MRNNSQTIAWARRGSFLLFGIASRVRLWALLGLLERLKQLLRGA